MAGTPKDPCVVAGDHQSHSGAHRHDRLLALEIRPQRFGFCVLEGTAKLMDWGIRTFENHSSHLASLSAKFNALLELYSPTVVVIRRRNRLAARAAKAVGQIVNQIGSEARRHSINVESVNAKTVRWFFGRYGCKTKHEIATTLADWFEELAWKLPPKRKPWQSEHPSALIFDAVATAVTLRGKE